MNPIKNNNMDFGEAYISKEMCIDLILSKYDNEDNLEIEKTILNYDGENVAELIESMINEKVLYYIEMLMNNINSIKNNIIENKKIYWE